MKLLLCSVLLSLTMLLIIICVHGSSLKYDLTLSDKIFENAIFSKTNVPNRIHCASSCFKADNCKGFGFDSGKTCFLLNKRITEEFCSADTCQEQIGMKVYMAPEIPGTTEQPTSTTTKPTTTTEKTTTTKPTTTTESPLTTTEKSVTTTEKPLTTTEKITTTTEKPTTTEKITTTTKSPTTTTKSPTTTTKSPTTTTETPTTTTSKPPTTTGKPTTTTQIPTTTTTEKLTTKTTEKATTTTEKPKTTTLATTTTTKIPEMKTHQIKCGLETDFLNSFVTKGKEFFNDDLVSPPTCFSVSPTPFESGSDVSIKKAGEEAAVCPGDSVVTEIKLTTADFIVESVEIACKKVKADFLTKNSIKQEQSSDAKSVSCGELHVVAGVKVTKRDGDDPPIYDVEFTCQEVKKLEPPKKGP